MERGGELAQLDEFIELTGTGRGGLLVIEGPAGIGKTRLLEALRERGEKGGFEVLRARGGELEREFAFGVVRQLLERRLHSESARERNELLSGAAGLAARVFGESLLREAQPVDAPDASFATLHGLYWLCANLARSRPLLFVIDDAHWADESSLRFLSFLIRRVDDLPVAVGIGARPNEPGADPMLIPLIADARTRVIRPGALSVEGVTEVVSEQLDMDVDRAFSDACHRVTGGNPFLLHELVRDLVADGVKGGGVEPERILQLSPRAVARSVLLRIARLPAPARELAESVAVFGDDVRLSHAAQLAGIDEEVARMAADSLMRIEVLRAGEPLGFIHPLVRASVYAELPPAACSAGHARAARLLLEAGVEPEQVGAQLLQCDATGEEWRVEVLRDAADRAMKRGAPGTAATLLRRGLDEVGPSEVRADVLYELGRAETHTRGPEAGFEVFDQAFQATSDPRKRALIALEQGSTRFARFDEFDEAVDRLDACMQELDGSDPDLERRIEHELIGCAMSTLRKLPLVFEPLARYRSEGTEALTEDPRGLSNLAISWATTIRGVHQGGELGQRAAEGELRAGTLTPAVMMQAPQAMLWAERFDAARSFCDAMLDRARRHGSIEIVAMSLSARAEIAYRLGALADAEADARQALDLYREWGLYPPWPLARLIDPLIERGGLDTAEALLAEDPTTDPLPETYGFNSLLFSRGCLRLAQRRVEQAIADLTECGRRLLAWTTTNPGVYPWRSTLALALASNSQSERARELADEEVAIARKVGTPRALGVSLRAAGLVRGGQAGRQLLQEAVQTLADSPARLEHARALTDLGASLRRAGRRREARDPLSNGLDGARRCGGSVLAERARAELAAAGAKPRRDFLRGRDALTSSELRIARMAADGMSNREIAQALFLTARTVETHLTHTYQKLDITSRTRLATALDQEVRPSA